MTSKKEIFKEVTGKELPSPFETGHQDLPLVIKHLQEGKPFSLEVIRFLPHLLNCQTCREEFLKASRKKE